MKSLLEIIKLGEQYLKSQGIDRARREAEDLIAEVLGTTRLALYLDFEKPLTEKELEKCRSYFKRRGQREPFQYIVGSLAFSGVHIKINPDVLIPRPETELLVKHITQELINENLEGKTLCDMCTGSGCIGISLKKKFPHLNVILSDISHQALNVASENARMNGVDVTICQGNMFDPLKGQMIDYFVSNPPYVTEDEYIQLSPEIRDYEPSVAFLAGLDGLTFYREIAKRLPDYLKEKAWLEIGSSQKDALLPLFPNTNWSYCHIEKDWMGKDRFLKLKAKS